MGYKNTNRRDENDSDIVEVFRRFGVPLIQGLPGQGFDYIAGLPSGIKLVEIKFPGREKLTEKEKKVQELFGDDFVVITIVEEAIALAREI